MTILPTLEAVGRLHDFTYLAARPINTIRGLHKKLLGYLYWQPNNRLLHTAIGLPNVEYCI